MGVSGSGKSTLGALLAARMGCGFLEGDGYHSTEAVAKMRLGTPLTDQDRWPWLDRLGAAIGDAARRDGAAVAACSALRRAYRDRLREAVGTPVRFVLLDNAREVILRRLLDRPGHYMPASLLDSQFATLERPTLDEGALTMVSDATPDELCGHALDWIRA
ncbi:MAG: gluconokinase [Novosphingobium sp.]|nr:gluconokinase [Novosphingobium sp.]